MTTANNWIAKDPQGRGGRGVVVQVMLCYVCDYSFVLVGKKKKKKKKKT